MIWLFADMMIITAIAGQASMEIAATENTPQIVTYIIILATAQEEDTMAMTQTMAADTDQETTAMLVAMVTANGTVAVDDAIATTGDTTGIAIALVSLAQIRWVLVPSKL